MAIPNDTITREPPNNVKSHSFFDFFISNSIFWETNVLPEYLNVFFLFVDFFYFLSNHFLLKYICVCVVKKLSPNLCAYIFQFSQFISGNMPLYAINYHQQSLDDILVDSFFLRLLVELLITLFTIRLGLLVVSDFVYMNMPMFVLFPSNHNRT